MNRTLTYPTPIWSDNFKDIDNKKLSEIVIQEREKDNGIELHPLDGWRTNNHDIFLNDDFEELIKTINLKMDLIIKEYEINPKYKLKQVGSWVYVTEKGGWHPPHDHCEAFLSCVYYIKVPEDSNSNIVFDNPKSIMYEKPDLFLKENILTYNRIPINPVEGDFIAFPGWFKHFVTPSMSDENRIVVTFNYALEES